ncbi:MAG: VanZ family protein [Solirubrobacterales bacterium]
MSRSTQRTLIRAAAPVVWMALIFAASATPDLSTGLGLWDFIGRKIVHALSFGILAWLWFWSLRGTIARPILVAATISVLYAISDEYHQSFVHGRHGTPRDVLIDCVGIAVVALLARSRGRARASRNR